MVLNVLKRNANLFRDLKYLLLRNKVIKQNDYNENCLNILYVRTQGVVNCLELFLHNQWLLVFFFLYSMEVFCG